MRLGMTRAVNCAQGQQYADPILAYRHPSSRVAWPCPYLDQNLKARGKVKECLLLPLFTSVHNMADRPGYVNILYAGRTLLFRELSRYQPTQHFPDCLGP